MKSPSTNEPHHPADEIHLTDVLFFEEGAPLSDASVEPLLREMGVGWRNGERPSVEDVLGRHPELADNADAVLRLICEEICLREEAGAEVKADEFLARFPRWQAELRSLLDYRQLIQAKPPAEAVLEHEAPTLSDFSLLTELGEGAQGQVYLATQPALADRPVVLKITRCHGDEHRALARLQHTHIVPLYWAQDDAENDRRILCMPYFGNVTLGDLFKTLKDKPPAQRTGRDVLDVLEAARSASKVTLPATGPARQFLARASYVEAVCWMGACVADALQYAHERGLLHLDIKPTNVLLAADGQPMLLDFHLAREPIGPDGPAPRGMGGTPYFMSPEQQLAMEAVCGGRKVTVVVDGRSDVYSLGLVLYQALSGQVPMQSPPPRLDQCNPRVSVGLADVIQSCLARDPKARYATAAALATDLRRHLGHLPLKGVRNRSWPERWRKWRKRKPHGLAISLLVLMMLATGLFVWSFALTQYERRKVEADNFLDGVGTLIDQGRPEQALKALDEWGSTSALLDGVEVRSKFTHLRWLAKHGRTVQTLHRVVDRLRFLTGAEDYTTDALRRLDEQCGELWGQRKRLLKDLEINAGTKGQRSQIHTDLLDLAVIWTELRVRLARKGEERRAWRQALDTLGEAEALTGRSPVLLFERETYATKLGLDKEAEKARADQKERKMAPRTGWEFCALGRSHLQRKDYLKALEYLDRAVEMEPHDVWPNFYQGMCAYRLKRYDDAVAAFRACITASAGQAREQESRYYYNRGLAEVARGRKASALKDFSEALVQNPELAAAALNRGILYFEEKKYDKAESDLKDALKNGCNPLAGHYNLARVSLELGNRPEARAHVRRALEVDPRHPESRELLRRLEAPPPR